MFNIIPRYGPARAVYDALKCLGITTVDQIALYTGLSKPEVVGILLSHRYGWVDLIDYAMSEGRHNQIGIWCFQGRSL